MDAKHSTLFSLHFYATRVRLEVKWSGFSKRVNFYRALSSSARRLMNACGLLNGRQQLINRPSLSLSSSASLTKRSSAELTRKKHSGVNSHSSMKTFLYFSHCPSDSIQKVLFHTKTANFATSFQKRVKNSHLLSGKWFFIRACQVPVWLKSCPKVLTVIRHARTKEGRRKQGETETDWLTDGFTTASSGYSLATFSEHYERINE